MNSWSQLEFDCTVIYFSPRGSDKSERPDEASDMTSRHMAEDLELIRQHLGLEKLDIIAHTSGATIALTYAILYPKRAAKLVLIDANLLGYDRLDLAFFAQTRKMQMEMQPKTDEQLKAFMFVILSRFFANLENVPTIQAKWTDTLSIWAFSAYYGADMKMDWKQNQELGKVTASTLVIVGKQDRVAPPELADAITNGVKGAELSVLEGSGHFPWIEKEDEFWTAVHAFLKR